MIGLTYDELVKLSPCPERKAEVVKMLGGAKKWDGKKISARQAVKAGVTFDDLLWAASAVAKKDKDVERRIRLWLADCAARVLHIYEKQVPKDMRVRDAIIASRQFARGEISAAAGVAAGAAARAAAGAAAWVAAGFAAGNAEEKWQLDRLVQWLSDPEPQDLEFPALQIEKAA